MAEANSDSTRKRAKEKLEQCRKDIVETKPSSTNIDYVDSMLHPSDPKDWQFIRYFRRINESVKTEFRKNQKHHGPIRLYGMRGKGGKGNNVGQHWDKVLSKLVQIFKDGSDIETRMCELTEELKCEISAERVLLRRIYEEFKIDFLDSHFPLYGYMYSKTEDSPKVYLWQGDADAVGWYRDSSGKERYVIVDWKVLDILDFWKKNKDAYGKYLHQCLVYARLLQLHLKLDYLPHILIVPISGVTGQDLHPMLFCDYPEMCKKKIESFEWSTTLPEPAQKISGKWPLFNDLPVGKVDENMPLHRLFDMDAKVSDLLKEFGWHSLEVTADKIKNELDESSSLSVDPCRSVNQPPVHGPDPSPQRPCTNFQRPPDPFIPFIRPPGPFMSFLRPPRPFIPFLRPPGPRPPNFYRPQNY